MAATRVTRSGKRAGFAGALVTALALGVMLASPASAHHPEITGTANCDATVTFTSTAWAGGSTDQRTNPKIAIEYAVDGGAFTNLSENPAYRYDSTNGFQFTDTFTPPAGWNSIRIKATAAAPWGSGVEAGDSRTTEPITPLTDCVVAADPAATVAAATCADEGAVVHLTNSGGSPVDFVITGGVAPVVATVAGGATRDVTVTLPEDTTSLITVTAPGMTTVTRSVTYRCAEALPSATIADATCAADGATVTLVNTGDAPAVFTTAVPGSADILTTVAAGQTVTITVPLPEDVTTAVTVSSPGMAPVVRNLSYRCVSAEEAAAAEAAAEEAARATREAQTRNVAGELPATGSPARTLGFVAVAVLLAGAAMIVAGRRRIVR